MLTTARLTAYALGVLGGAAALAAAFGYGVYDPVAQTYDPGPIKLHYIAGFVGAVAGNGLALVALVKGWAGWTNKAKP